jgi:hypothetical protein
VTKKWAPGNRVADFITNKVGTILPSPDVEVMIYSDYCIYVEWEDGERGWVSKDEVKRL